MSNNLSVMKRIAIAERNRARNKVYKSTIKTLTKKYNEEARKQLKSEAHNLLSLQKLLNLIYSKIDKAVKKGILHRNNAARKKSCLAKLITNP
uniref:Ribosomal protein S20 n=1 Tax=Acrochaetium secundatum TaxID=209631 RepID=A0A4D6BMM0_9FLOR|nr:ribosomal protein S20 [Acrochaetium secundatum]QBX88458.1 ribosomal protein S20 [Acrochaetium secundatum]